MSDLNCSVSGCGGKHEARGYCSKHYQRLRNHGDPLAVRIFRRETLLQALTDGHTKKPDSGCWEWHETRTAKGYGVIRHKGKTMAAHRSAYATFIGPLSDGMQINHKCDNPPCINPAHLYQGTQRDNVADMIARGRIDRKGVNCNGLRKLDEAMVRQIRASHMSTRKAAALFGVSQHTISDVRTGKSWGHICQI